jgi:hypothetical protein
MKNKGNMREALFFLIPNQKWVSIKSQKESLIQRVNLKKTNHTQFRQKRKKKKLSEINISIYYLVRYNKQNIIVEEQDLSLSL